MIKLKILTTTFLHPSRNNLRVYLMNSIQKNLSHITDTTVVWVVFQPDRFSPTKNEQEWIIDIHDFDDAVSLLKEIKPDCVLVTYTYDTIQHSLSMAAKFLQIPLISIYWKPPIHVGIKQIKAISLKNNISTMLRNFVSSKVSTDSKQQKHFFRRGRFALYKYNYLIKTQNQIGKSFLYILKFSAEDIFKYMQSRMERYNLLADLHLLCDDSWIDVLKYREIAKEKLLITGNPMNDRVFGKIKNPTKKFSNMSNLKILVVTDSLYEHGLWSQSERDAFVEYLLSEIKGISGVSITVKIHPSSEDFNEYQEILAKNHSDVILLQHEDLLDIVDKYDLVVSYGESNSHEEVILSERKLILVDVKVLTNHKRIIQHGVSSGLVQHVSDIKSLGKIIPNFLKQPIDITEEFASERTVMCDAGDTSGETVAKAIIALISKSKAN